MSAIEIDCLLVCNDFERTAVEMLKEHLGHCIEGAIVSGDRDEQRRKAAELIQLLERTR